MFLSLLNNKYILEGIFALLILSYLTFYVNNLKHTIKLQESKITKLSYDYNICKTNLNTTIKVNKNNINSINQYKEDVIKINEAYEKIISSKDKTILSLKKIIADKNTTTTYPNIIKYKECNFKIKGINDAKKDDLLYGLGNIGK